MASHLLSPGGSISLLRLPLVLALLLFTPARAHEADRNDPAPAGGTPPAPQVFPLSDASSLTVIGGKADGVEYLGRKAVRLIAGENSDIFAYLNGTGLQDGAIDVDIAVKITTPPGVRMPGFTGIAFHARPDGSHYDMFYMRPKNALSTDQAMRNHSVQYVAKPGYDWYLLRRRWPWIYEAWANLTPETWTHVRIEVQGRTARLSLNGSASPSLVVNGLKGEDLHGGVALWGDSGEESYFSNLRVTRDKPLPIHNGSDAAGTWHVVFASDYGKYEGNLDLHREGNAVTGTWTGDFGQNLPVTGTWREGYVELSFTANWQEDQPKTGSTPAPALLAGWIDDDSAAGRMKVEGRADGPWSAERKK